MRGENVSIVSEKTLSSLAPKTFEYLLECKSTLNERENGRFKGEGWYCYGRPQNMNKFEIPEKIILPDIANRGECYLDIEQRWILDTAYAIVPLPRQKINVRYLLGILNSPLLTYYLKETGTALRGGYFRMKTAYLNPFPIPIINFSDAADRAKHGAMVQLVEGMLNLHKMLATAKTPQEKEYLERNIAARDNEIDKLVYALYRLTEDEIKIVEGG